MNTRPRDSAPLRTLAMLAPGERGVISAFAGDPAVARRLMELGIVPGTEIEMVRTAPLGDPIEVAVRGAHLSLRRTEANHIHVEHC